MGCEVQYLISHPVMRLPMGTPGTCQGPPGVLKIRELKAKIKNPVKRYDFSLQLELSCNFWVANSVGGKRKGWFF